MAVELSSEPITETEVEDFCVEMMKRLDIQRRNEHFCDVIVEVGSGDDQARLKAHRIVLCAASPFFYNALNSDMKEKDEGVIRLKETSKAVMEEVLEYLYTGHVDINEQNAYDLMAVADYFIIPSLKILSGKIIQQTLSLSNCIVAYLSAITYRCEELQKEARDFIQSNFVTVAKTEDFVNLSSKEVEEWISSDEIIVEGEEEVFEVVMKWIEKSESRKQCLPALFRHIRFIYIKRDFLFNVILSNPLVKDNLECSNLVLDAMKLAFNGTDVCYFAQPPRNCLKTHEDAIVACGSSNETICFIPSENKWYKLADMGFRRPLVSQAMSSCHGNLYFIGGSGYSNCRAECYYPSINTWTSLKSFNQELKLTSVATFQGALYVIGGMDKDDRKVNTVQEYNPDMNLWREVAPLSIARNGVCAVADRNSLYAVGGFSDSGRVGIAERFDPTEKVWSRTASTHNKRGDASGATVNQKIFIFGGLESEVPVSHSCEVYDPVVDAWHVIESAVSLRSGFSSAVSFKGKIVLCGQFGENFSEKYSLQMYDVNRNEWHSCKDIPLSSEKWRISCLRMPREVLDTCGELRVSILSPVSVSFGFGGVPANSQIGFGALQATPRRRR